MSDMKLLLKTVLCIAIAIGGLDGGFGFSPGNNPGKTELEQLRLLAADGKLDEHIRSVSKPRATLSGVGTKQVLVLPCYFDDVRYTYTKESIEQKFVRGKEKSLANYYWDASGGRMDIQFGSKGIPEWIKMPKPYAKYDTLEQLMEDAFKAAQKIGYDLSEYDMDGNGWPDLVTFVWAGNSWAVGGDMPGAFTYPMDIGWYIFIAEDVRAGFPMITIIHEFAHQAIPLWDTYDYAGMSVPVGAWDLMADGVWQGYCGLPAFQRWKAGWLEPVSITEPGTYYIDDLNGEGPNKMLKIPIPGSQDEWLCLENRSRKGSDGYFQGAPETGLVIYHIDDKRGYKHLFNSLFQMDGVDWNTYGIMVLDPSGSNLRVGAVYGADRGRTKITPYTIPNTLPYRSTGVDKSIHITEISERGPRMSFKLEFLAPDRPVVSVPDQLSFGKIVKGRKLTRGLNFRNSGSGKLFVVIKPQEPYISIDRTSFIGNDEVVEVTINASNLKLGKYKTKIGYYDQSSDATGYVECNFEVIPIEGDINGDGTVTLEEIDEFLKVYGSSADQSGYKSELDFNSDGVIDITDMMMIARNFKGQ